MARVGFRCGNMVTGEALAVDHLAVSGHRLACVSCLQPAGACLSTALTMLVVPTHRWIVALQALPLRNALRVRGSRPF